MKQKIAVIAVLLSLIIGFLVWWFSVPQVLTRRSAELIDCIRMEEGTGRLQRSYKADNLRDLAADTITVTYPEMKSTFLHSAATNAPITLSEDRAKSALLYLTEMADWITVKNEEINVVGYSDEKATVRVTFQLEAKLKGKAVQSTELDGTFTYHYIENRWLLAAATFQ